MRYISTDMHCKPVHINNVSYIGMFQVLKPRTYSDVLTTQCFIVLREETIEERCCAIYTIADYSSQI
jgi:hypothetical protein